MSDTKDIVFDANTFGHDEVPVESVINGEAPGYSTDVLIDIDGFRRNFQIGWYDHEDKQWNLHAHGFHVTVHMRWSFLQLAIYEAHPELKRTVKV